MTIKRSRAAMAALALGAGLSTAPAATLTDTRDGAFYAQLKPAGRFGAEEAALWGRGMRAAQAGETSSLLMTRSDSAGSGVLSVPCRLGVERARCQLDSGASMSLIRDDEGSQSYPSVGRAQFSGASGQATTAAVIRVPDLRAGGIDLGAQTMVRVGMGFGARQNEPALIGITAFGRMRRLSFEFSAKRLRAGAAPWGGPAYKLYRSSQGHLILPVAINGERGLALWDTGASLTVVDPQFIREHPEGFELLGSTTIRDIANQPMRAGIFRARSLKVGLYDFEDVVVAGVDSNAFFPEIRAKRLAPAILGYNLITRADWTMDLKNGRWAASKPIAQDYLASTVRLRARAGLASVGALGGLSLPGNIRLRLPRGRITLAADP